MRCLTSWCISDSFQDTEFPGVVARPIGEFRSTSDYQYQLLRCNVDLLKIIQLGMSLYDSQGNQPMGGSTWQFNFKFNLTWVPATRKLNDSLQIEARQACYCATIPKSSVESSDLTKVNVPGTWLCGRMNLLKLTMSRACFCSHIIANFCVQYA